MKKVFKYSILAISILSISSVSASEFDSVYSFGDSLSDGGAAGSGSRFISGDNSKLFNEILSEHYTGNQLIPFTDGGNNYAQSGSSTANPVTLRLRADLAIDYYLSQHGGKADSKGIYTLWTGANDITYDVDLAVANFNLGALFNKGPHYELSNAPAEIAQQAKKLLDAGAGYVVVPNIPRAGLAPWAETVLFTLGQALLPKNLVDLPGLYQQLDQALRTEGPIQGEDQRQNAVVDALSKVFSENGIFIPRAITQSIYSTVLNVENTLTDQMNNDTEIGLSKLHGNIVRADVNGLFNEIIADPKRYGFDNVLAPVCQIGVGAPFCDSSTPSYHDDQIYLFSDWFHPSAQAHLGIAQYIESILDAPYYATTLSNAIEGLNDEHRLFLQSQLQQMRVNPTSQKVVVFGGYSGKYRNIKGEDSQLNGRDHTNSGDFGFAIQTLPGLNVGGTLSAGNGEFNSSSNYRYKYRGKVMSLFSQLQLDNGVWGNLETSFGDVSLDNIRRKITLYKGTRVETGSTDSHTFGVAANAGYDYQVTDYLSTGPVLGYSYDKYTVNGYRENGNTSTSMHFGKQNREVNKGKVGWRLDTRNLIVNPYIEASYNHNFTDNAPRVRGAINTTATSFYRDGEKPARDWAEVRVGASSNVVKNMGVFGSVNYDTGNNNTDEVSYTVGLNYSF